ncbi:post-GPI attachment to proteins factor 3 [Phtheirospermum japonicum]|uniref:Post-GPI attachment to proteins factor 3 n=1 Tax=Phtheirospermum japonicum TaxID=374723 RepID=A0A830BUA3_9LAMI|nr:post-GPI attachment to proteins factor 3 [Phtheirospermum japonicum]
MANCYWIICFLVLSCLVEVYEASAGDSDPLYREQERTQLGEGPIKYHGKWPIQRLLGFQEPLSVVFSALNIVVHFHGLLSYCSLVYNKLPLKPDKKPFYDHAGLWRIYGLLSINAWFWSAVFHSRTIVDYRDIGLTEKLDYSSAVALLGYSLIVAIIRCFGLRLDAAKVMVSAPLIAFTTTHILFLHNYEMDYGWNMKVSVAMGIAQLLIWAIWACVTRHPSRCKLWAVVVGGGLAMLLEIYDFPPYQGLLDAHTLWHASTIPLNYIWWSFIKDDAKYRTSILLKKEH